MLAGSVAGLGLGAAIGGVDWFSLAAHDPRIIIPFATSIVLVIGSPEAEPAQPRALAMRRLRKYVSRKKTEPVAMTVWRPQPGSAAQIDRRRGPA